MRVADSCLIFDGFVTHFIWREKLENQEIPGRPSIGHISPRLDQNNREHHYKEPNPHISK
jgi:hypothetical protein